MKLQEGGFIKRWTREFFPTGSCDDKTHLEATSIKLEDLTGVFVILYIGIVCGALALITETVIKRIRWTQMYQL